MEGSMAWTIINKSAWRVIKTPASGKQNSLRENHVFRNCFATPLPRKFVCSLRSGAKVADAAAQEPRRSLALAGLQQLEVKAVTAIRPLHLGLPWLLCPGPDGQNLATSSMGFRKSRSENSRNLRSAAANVLLCTIPSAGSAGSASRTPLHLAHLPAYKGVGSANIQVYTSMPPRSCCNALRRCFAGTNACSAMVLHSTSPYKDLLINTHVGVRGLSAGPPG